ncbi:hypothetical protein VNO78_19385 [Psophocarpus tetragonolobus]|uniref:C-8 sterol isomerase n=1 Tax=Psophocarpus tetragonolobus TaxID=3891 RepID=A0AAN9S932_PSOTE
MRTVYLQSKSSDEDNSCYFPGCKKDANCKCEMCLASINATLDLMPTSVHKTTLTKPILHSTPISFDASILSTPTSSDFQLSSSTPLSKSSHTSHSSHQLEQNLNKGQPASPFTFFRLLLFFGFFLSADLLFPFLVSRLFQPSLSPHVVKRVGLNCSRVHDLNAKLGLLHKELANVVAGQVSNCAFTDSLWKISQDGLLLHSRCTLYKSAIEEVAIWGWPLQTAGLLTNGFSSRTFILLSGRVTKWNAGQVGYMVRRANASWVQPKWDASAVQLDPNTWVLEYQRSSISDGRRLYSAVLEFLKYKISRFVGRLKKKFWLFVASEDNHYNGFKANNGFQFPT